MKKRKKHFAITATVIVMAFALCVTLISCGGNEKITEAGTVKENTQTEKSIDEKVVGEKTSDKTGEKTSKENSKSNESTKSTQSTQATKATKPNNVCYVSVEGYCSNKTVTLTGGDTAYSVLKASGATVSADSTQFGIYVEGINGRFASGNSGWLYSVNGHKPNVGAASYGVSNGDAVNWYWGSAY